MRLRGKDQGDFCEPGRIDTVPAKARRIVGSAEEELPCELDGAPLTIAFNPNYLLDSLGALHTDKAQLTFTTPNRPALVRPVPAPPGS